MPTDTNVIIRVNPYQKYLGDKHPIRVMTATPTRLNRLIDNLTTRQLARRLVVDKWSIHEIIAHLADVELVHCGRCRWMLFEENPPLPLFDHDAWVKGWRREKEPISETLARFRLLRQSQLRLFRNLTPEDLDRIGQHSERGQECLRDYIAKSAGHDLNHLQQISELKKQLLS